MTSTSSPNVHYKPGVVYAGLMQLSINGGYAESTIADLRLRYGMDAPGGAAFLYRLKMLEYDEWYSRLKEVNDAVLSVAGKLGPKGSVVCAVDYTWVPYYGAFNRYVVRSRHENGTSHFYEYATMSIVQDGLRLCVCSRPVTLLDVKVDVVKGLVDETTRKRGVRVRLLLLDRAFLTVKCINLLKELGLEFVMPCVCNERVQGAVDSFGREGRIPFSIRDSSGNETSFTMVVCWSEEKGKLIPFATNVEGGARGLARTIPKEYRRRRGIETSFRKVKEAYGKTLSPSPAIRLAYFMVAMVLYNLWQAVNMALATGDERGRKRGGGYHVTMPFMVTILCAHLDGRL